MAPTPLTRAVWTHRRRWRGTLHLSYRQYNPREPANSSMDPDDRQGSSHSADGGRLDDGLGIQAGAEAFEAGPRGGPFVPGRLGLAGAVQRAS